MMMMISADGEEELSCRCRPLSLDFTKEHIAGCEDDDDDDDDDVMRMVNGDDYPPMSPDLIHG